MKTRLLNILVIISTLAILNSCSVCNFNYQEPDGLITPAEANEMEELYKTRAFGVIQDNINSGGVMPEVTYNREVWFSADEMRNYLHYAQIKSDSLRVNFSGLRVYLSAKEMVDSNGVAKVKTTLFFVPTHTVVDTTAIRQSITTTTTEENTEEINPLNYGSSGEPAIEYTTP